MAENATPTTLEAALERIVVLENEVAEVRAEAARHRVAKREAAADAKNEAQKEFDAKLAEMRKQAEEVGVQLSSKSADVAKLKAALNTMAPTLQERVVDIANRLIGNTDAELVEDAKRVKAMYGITDEVKTSATDPSQGAGNTEALALNGDPLMNMINAALGNRPGR